MKEAWMEKLQNLVREGSVSFDEPMSAHTTFKIGGPAQCFVCPAFREIREVLDFCREQQIPVTVIGNGSNLLVGDLGIEGVVLSLGRPAAGIEIQGLTLRVQAGALLSQTAHAAAEAGLSGMEFAAGIPGSLGGAVVMNAGAYGGEMKDIVVGVTVLTGEGEQKIWTAQEMDFGYRHSRIMETGCVVLEAELTLVQGEMDQIRAKMEDFRRRRADKQPLDYPSAGSTFKRPEGYFAGKLIMDTGLAGYSVGGAQVSEKHCGFIVNTGGATARDVKELIAEVERRVRETFGVCLEPEIRMIGRF